MGQIQTKNNTYQGASLFKKLELPILCFFSRVSTVFSNHQIHLLILLFLSLLVIILKLTTFEQILLTHIRHHDQILHFTQSLFCQPWNIFKILANPFLLTLFWQKKGMDIHPSYAKYYIFKEFPGHCWRCGGKPDQILYLKSYFISRQNFTAKLLWHKGVRIRHFLVY